MFSYNFFAIVSINTSFVEKYLASQHFPIQMPEWNYQSQLKYLSSITQSTFLNFYFIIFQSLLKKFFYSSRDKYIKIESSHHHKRPKYMEDWLKTLDDLVYKMTYIFLCAHNKFIFLYVVLRNFFQFWLLI